MKEENNDQIPKGWKWTISSDILDIRDGTHDTPKYVYENGIPLITSKNLKDNKIDFEKVNYISKDDHNKISIRSKVEEGDILFAMIGTIGNPAIIKGDSNFSIKNVGLFKKNENIILPSFLVNYLRSYCFNKQLNERKLLKGTTQRFIPLGNLRKINIPLPPISAQLAIVSKIEELFSELDKGVEQLKTAQQQLKTYRQSVLKWAFEGNLTNDLVNNSADLNYGHHLSIAAEDEPEYKTKKNQVNQNNHINNSSDKGELPKGWKWVESGDFFDFVTSGSRGWAKYYSDKGAIFIRITNLDFDSLELDLVERKIQYVNPPSASEGIRTKVQEGDFLFSITGYLGMLAIAPKLENAYVNQHVCLCRPKSNFNKKYLGYWIISKSGGHHYLNQNQKGAVKAGLNLGDLKTFPVPLCPVDEQDEIVKAIETRLSISDKMEESINQSLQQAEALMQSILKKAFEGSLLYNS